MKVAIVTYTDARQAPLAKLARPNRQQYCQEHGYALMWEENLVPRPGVHVAWYKALKILEVLPEFDFVFWLDADALFMRMDVPLDSMFPPGGKVITVSCGGSPFTIQSGACMFCRSYETYKYLAMWWGLRHEITHVWRDQEALIELYRRHPELYNLVAGRDIEGFDVGNVRDLWHPGDLIVHFPGRGIATKERLMREWLKKVEGGLA